MKTLFSHAMLLAAAGLLTLGSTAMIGCNTVEGAGKDLQQSSEKVGGEMDKGWDSMTDSK